MEQRQQAPREQRLDLQQMLRELAVESGHALAPASTVHTVDFGRVPSLAQNANSAGMSSDDGRV
ncbi:hypothetical protein AZ34_07380 [Hylemonella gracilis str. Niagara R]|uniref:Uncharacterized protein n=2 Tax=Hylemonella gracilis TaxID=80880 RepID=A0A016XLP7_9BURK|nr:hypothetical protein AZ34_07380 [Hylemonella gracilis str. Niagara R]